MCRFIEDGCNLTNAVIRAPKDPKEREKRILSELESFKAKSPTHENPS
jgi:hypothetical protein